MFSLITSLGINAQTDSAQIKQLREELNIPNSSVILVNEYTTFPDGNIIKIFPSIKHNKKFAKDFVKWVDKWNRENSKQNGTLQIVDKIEEADVIAVQFRYGTRDYVREESISLSTSDKITKDHDFFGQTIGNSKIKAKKGHRKLDFPLYSYILVRGVGDTWFVNFSYMDETRRQRDNFSEVRLEGKINNQMKDR